MLDNNNNNNKQNIQKNFKPGPEILKELYEVICDRKVNRKEGSYTNYLFDKGLDKILKGRRRSFGSYYSC